MRAPGPFGTKGHFIPNGPWFTGRQAGHTDGVLFSIEYIGAKGSHQILFDRYLDPTTQARDRGFQHLSALLPEGASGQELEQVKLVNGLDLQLLAYLGVLRDAANVNAAGRSVAR